MLIGLNGRARSGKDTVCGFVKEWGEGNGFVVRREAFADRLKLSAARLFRPEIGLEDAVAWCNEVKEFGTVTVIVESEAGRRAEVITGRELLQRFGTESHREVFGSDFWINAALANLDPSEITVVTDVRFENEAEAIRSRGGVVWEVTRPGLGIVESDHPSERPLPSVDWPIANDGTLDDLRELVFATLERRVMPSQRSMSEVAA